MLSLTDDPHLKIKYHGKLYTVDFAFDTVINYFNPDLKLKCNTKC